MASYQVSLSSAQRSTYLCQVSLSSISAKLARLARGDLLRAVGHLSTNTISWTKDCDATLLRHMRYLKGSRRFHQVGVIGDDFKDLQLCLYTDADVAGDRSDLKSTSGVFLALVGTNSFWPLCGQSKKQTAVSHSTVEADLVACVHGLRSEGLPPLLLWEPILGRKTSLVLYQDNQATMRIIQTGKTPTLRHIRRVHQVCVAWLHERVKSDDIDLKDCATDAMAADILINMFINGDKWLQVSHLVCVVTKSVARQLRPAPAAPAVSPVAAAVHIPRAPALTAAAVGLPPSSVRVFTKGIEDWGI